MAKLHGFTKRGAKRIVDSVRWTEGQSRGKQPKGPGGIPLIPTIIRRIELAEDLTEGATVEAYILDCSSGTCQRIKDAKGSDYKIDVEDALSTFTGDAGDIGYAAKLPDNANWEIVQLECP